MAEFFKFDELEIVFSDDFSSSNDDQSTFHESDSNSRSFIRRNKIFNWKKESCFVPVNIPGSNSISSSPSSFRYDDEIDFGAQFSDNNEIVPPHVIVDQRSRDLNTYERKSSGNRGKKLIYVRNFILKLTGFLES
ncbi:protein S40-1-like [Amaranthus tricolor]|uniref:protein S40-1-like n=1 Tax=Amaranthus tricolor TaxID=29722 RepID=UPI0025890E12|nr:protein S40-1-like [Amaranthus tricolor]